MAKSYCVGMVAIVFFFGIAPLSILFGLFFGICYKDVVANATFAETTCTVISLEILQNDAHGKGKNYWTPRLEVVYKNEVYNKTYIAMATKRNSAPNSEFRSLSNAQSWQGQFDKGKSYTCFFDEEVPTTVVMEISLNNAAFVTALFFAMFFPCCFCVILWVGLILCIKNQKKYDLEK